MKLFILSSIVLFFSLITPPVHGQEMSSHQEKNNYVVLTKKVPQLKPIILSAQELAVEDGNTFGKFEVVICGKTVRELTDPEVMQKYISQAEQAGVELVACGFSLKKFGVDRQNIPSQLRVVENGILYNFQLQKKGYTSITL